MWEKFAEKLFEFVALFQVFLYVDEFERAVILRKGKFHRVVEPGFRWIWPMNFERAIKANIKPEPMYLDVQSLLTGDDWAANIQIGIIWRIIDIREFLLENDDTEDIVSMLCCGVVSRSVQGAKWKDLREDGYPDTLRAPMNRKVRKRGAEIDEVIIQDFTTGSADRLWHEGIALSLGED